MADTSTPALTTVVIDRTFDAPRELVWKAFTEPERIKQWWGPEHFDCPEAIVDLRVGGAYRFAMRGPDGHTNWSGGVYTEIVPMERYVASQGFMDAEGNLVHASALGLTGDWPDELTMTLTVTFEDAPGGKTNVRISQEGMPVHHAPDNTAGWNSQLDKLAATLR
jgi:uncharacterized protein YndB with AHSA1/START domain